MTCTFAKLKLAPGDNIDDMSGSLPSPLKVNGVNIQVKHDVIGAVIMISEQDCVWSEMENP